MVNFANNLYTMHILLLGSGGRENALAWKIEKSHHCNQLFIAPGNTGTAAFGKNVPILPNDFMALKEFCIQEKIDMLVVGPEEPLVNGIYDFFTNDPSLANIMVIGPSAVAAQLEGSKAFSKKFMQRHGIPTAAYAEFTESNYEEGKQYIAQQPLPIVLKADGLAAGKGVVIAQTHQEALATFENMIIHQQFGKASNKVIIEEFLSGIEVSVFALTDGESYQIIGHAKDYKRIGEGDTGLNTGGMGCVSPVPFMDKAFMEKVTTKIIAPTIQGIYKDEMDYHGFVFFGLMKVGDEPIVIEYNCRMGDPETEVVLPLLQTDIVGLFAAVSNGTLSDANIEFYPKSCATIVAVSGGYPGNYQKHLPISGLEKPISNDCLVFHAGTETLNGQVVTNGGRVLAVSAYGESLKESVFKSMETLAQLSFEGMYFRKDIGYEFI